MPNTKETIPPCGLYCGVCAIYNAHQSNGVKSKKLALAIYKRRAGLSSSSDIDIEDIKCDGCRSNNLFVYCKECNIRECADTKGYEGCYQCEDFPCEHIDNFPVPEGRKTILNSIPNWKKLGTEKWIKAEEAKYTCKECGNKMFRGAIRCQKCRAELNL